MRFIGFLIAIAGGAGTSFGLVYNYYAGNEIWVAIMAACTFSNLLLGIYWAKY